LQEPVFNGALVVAFFEQFYALVVPNLLSSPLAITVASAIPKVDDANFTVGTTSSPPVKFKVTRWVS
jgi:hypothetical protein